jgi:hypothetical protein
MQSEIHHRVHKSSLLNLILNKMNEADFLTLSFYEINLLLDLHPRLDLCLSDFPTKILHAFVVFVMRAACAAQFILFNLIILIIIIIIIIIIWGQLPFKKKFPILYSCGCLLFRNFYRYPYCYVCRLVYSRYEWLLNYWNIPVTFTASILRFWTLSIILFLSKTPSCLYFKTQHFGDWILSPSSGKTYSVGPNA